MWKTRVLYLIGVLAGLAILAAGAFLLIQDETGTRVEATVTDCNGAYNGYNKVRCTGTWVVGGALTAGGHVETGDVQGADYDDLGKTVHATVRHGTAYKRGLTLPLILIGVGVLVAGGAAWLGSLFWSPDPPATTTS